MAQVIEYEANKHKGIDRKNQRWNGDHNFAFDIENGYAYREPGGLGFVQQRNGTNDENSTVLIGATTKLRVLFEANWATGTDVKLTRSGTSWYYHNAAAGGSFTAISAATMTADTIAFVDSGPDTLTDSGSGFLDAGFVVGQSITITGSTSNNKTVTIATVVAGTITLVAADELVAEIAGDTVTIADENAGARAADARGMCTTWTDGTNDYVVAVDGGIPIKIKSDYTWSTLSADANMPQNATCVHTHNSRLWMNEPGTSKIHGCKLLDGTNTTSWTTGNSDKITLDLQYKLPEYDEALRIESYGDSLLVVFCANNTVIYSAPETFADIDWIETVPGGVLSSNASKPTKNDLIYPERSALKSIRYYTNVKTNIKDLTVNTRSMYTDYIDDCSNVLDISDVYIKDTDHYLVTIPNSTASKTQTLVYSESQKTIVGRYRFKDDAGNYITPYSWLEDQLGDIYFGADNGHMYKFDSDYYSDDGTIIPWLWDSMYFGADMPNKYKKPHSTSFGVKAEIRSGSATTSLSLAESMTLPLRDADTFAQSITHTITPSDDNPFYFPKVPTKRWKGRDKLAGFRLSHSSLDVRIQLTNFKYAAQLQGEM